MNRIIDLATQLQSNGVPGAALLLIVKITIVLLIVRLLVTALPRISAASKHLLITAGLCGVVVMPLLSVVTPAMSIVIERQPPPKEIGSRGVETQSAPTALGTAITIASVTGVVEQERLDRFSQTLDQLRRSWQGFLLLALAAVSALFIGQMFAGMIGVWLVTRRSTEIDDEVSREELDLAERRLGLWPTVRLLRSQRVSVPVIWGVFRPALLLPEESKTWSRERLRVVLLHELAHLKRFDGVTLIISRIAVALYWFQPLAWSLHERARGECERACDDLVLAGGTRPSDYAEHLLSIARALPQSDPFRSVTLAMTRRSQLEGRLLSILQPDVRRRAFTIRAIVAVAVLGLGVVVPFAALRVTAEPPNGFEARKEKPAKSTIDVTPETASKDKWVWEEDLENLEDAVDMFKGEHQDWYWHGMELHRAKRFDAAIAAFHKSIEEGHKVEASHYNIACGFARKDDPDRALEALRDAFDAGFTDFETLMSDEDLDRLREDPRFPELAAEFQKSFEQKQLDHAEQLQDHYEELSASASRDPHAWSHAGLQLLQLRRLDESIDALRKAVALSDSSVAMYNLACAYSLRGDMAASLEWLRRSIANGFDNPAKIESDPDLEPLRKDPRFEKIRRMAADFTLAPQSPGNWLGDLLNHSEWDASVDHHREVARVYPTEGRPWFNLGYAELQKRNATASIDAFQRAMKLGYLPPVTAYNIACAYSVAGRADEAFLWLEKARAAGFDLGHRLEKDSDLDGLRDDPRYERLLRETVDR